MIYVLSEIDKLKGAQMKTSKSEIAYLILSIILIAVAGGTYFVFGHKTTASSQVTKTQQTSSSSDSSQDLIVHAEALLSDLEANPSRKALTLTQEIVDKIKDDSKKKELQTRLEAVATEVGNQETAERAVSEAEADQTTAKLEQAQAIVDTLTNQAKKNELQARLDTVQNAINQAAQAAAASQASASNTYTADQNAAYTSQTDSATNYSEVSGQ